MSHITTFSLYSHSILASRLEDSFCCNLGQRAERREGTKFFSFRRKKEEKGPEMKKMPLLNKTRDQYIIKRLEPPLPPQYGPMLLSRLARQFEPTYCIHMVPVSYKYTGLFWTKLYYYTHSRSFSHSCFCDFSLFLNSFGLWHTVVKYNKQRQTSYRPQNIVYWRVKKSFPYNILCQRKGFPPSIYRVSHIKCYMFRVLTLFYSSL